MGIGNPKPQIENLESGVGNWNSEIGRKIPPASKPGMKVFGEDAETECARLRLELAALRREAEASRSAVEVQVRG